MSETWTEVTVSVPAADADRAADIANMTVPYGLYVEDYSDLEQGAWEIAHIDLIDEELLARDRTRALIHVYLEPEVNPAESLAFLSERLSAAGIDNTLKTRSVCQDDWANNWKAFFKPLPVGEKLLILPTWEQDSNPENRRVLHIDPGMAFGTGGHETTRLVLETLEQVVQAGDHFLDIGCGSGILSIAALLFGAADALGVDIDELAVKTARENGQLNGMEPPRYTIVQGDLAEKVTGRYEVVAANIVADAIIALSPAVPAFLKPGGAYVVSGIIDTREAEVTEALTRCGFRVAARAVERGWVCLLCRRENE